MLDVDIYYCRVCGLCTRTIEFFRDRGVTFRALAIEWDAAADAFRDSENARAMMRRCGKTMDFVPQIFIGERHIAGWRALEPMIENGELDRLLPKQG